ncbi:MAG: transcriptional repressor NrdR [Candidatus Omnitrophica bacterium]|nr:transcriptional repressor NrdR [Candidatus Omnitrophota bacterium]
MKCPACHKETKVVDSRLNSEGTSIRRRRECLKCSKRFTTHEYVEQVSLLVIKKDGRRQAYDRSRIITGMLKACEKRPVSINQIEEIAVDIEREIQKKHDREVPSSVIGELIMEKLYTLDEVAYVRFASVYRQFRDVNHFMNEIKVILEKERDSIRPGARKRS